MAQTCLSASHPTHKEKEEGRYERIIVRYPYIHFKQASFVRTAGWTRHLCPPGEDVGFVRHELDIAQILFGQICYLRENVSGHPVKKERKGGEADLFLDTLGGDLQGINTEHTAS